MANVLWRQRTLNVNPAPTQRRSRVLLLCLNSLPEKHTISELFAGFSRQVWVNLLRLDVVFRLAKFGAAQPKLRLKKWCKAISLLPSNLHYATSLQTLKSLSITCKRWSMLSCVHASLWGSSSKRRECLSMKCVATNHSSFWLIHTAPTRRSIACLEGNTPTTRVRFFISLLSLSQRLFVRIQWACSFGKSR